jgi:DNA-binding MarR family transcriptional regulator
MMALSRNVESRKNSESRLVSLTPTSVSAYLDRCIKRGLVKVSQAPARRYAYYLTPQGFAEKSRLTVEYLSYSFSFFRQAKADCARVFELAKEQKFQNLVFCGKSDLAR